MGNIKLPVLESPEPVAISYGESVRVIESKLDNYNWNVRKAGPKVTAGAKPTYGILVSLLQREAEKMRQNSPVAYRFAWSEHSQTVPVSFSYGQIVKLGYSMQFSNDKARENKKRTIRNYLKRFVEAGFLASYDDTGRGSIRAQVNKDWLAYSLPKSVTATTEKQLNYVVVGAKTPKNLNTDNQQVRYGYGKNFPPSSNERTSTLKEREDQEGATQLEQPAIAGKDFRRSPVVTSGKIPVAQAPPPPAAKNFKNNSQNTDNQGLTRIDFGKESKNALTITTAAILKHVVLADVEEVKDAEGRRKLVGHARKIVERELTYNRNQKEVLRKLLLGLAHTAEQQHTGQFTRLLGWEYYLSTDTDRFRRGGTFITTLGGTYRKFVTSLEVPFSYQKAERDDAIKQMQMQEVKQLLFKQAMTVVNYLMPTKNETTIEKQRLLLLRKKLMNDMAKKCKGQHLDEYETNAMLRKIVTMTSVFGG